MGELSADEFGEREEQSELQPGWADGERSSCPCCFWLAMNMEAGCMFGFSEWRFRLRLDEKILSHPSTVHLCVSFMCTALVWIFSAPLSQ